ncbi:MAG: NAD-dependent protein deacylase [Bacilli bacterium]
MLDEVCLKVIEQLKSCKFGVFFGGAGVSVPSMIPDFRGSMGLQHKLKDYSFEEILSRSFLQEHPQLFYDYYRQFFYYPNAKPNIIHETLALLEQKGAIKVIITQNIDNLHWLAKSPKVIELHGNTTLFYCERCFKKYPATVVKEEPYPKCACGGLIRPDIVLYEESLNEGVVDEAIGMMEKADLLIIGGTSLLVYPAAGFISYFQGKNLIIINKEPTPFDKVASLVIHDNLEKVFSIIKHYFS